MSVGPRTRYIPGTVDAPMPRRRFLLLLAAVGALPGVACKREPRCPHCGMRIDPASAWRVELVAGDGSRTSFDTPRCALVAWRSGKFEATSMRAQEYYERTWHDAKELRFVLGGDVLGPMGSDLVPVDPARVAKFIQDHGADRALALDEITSDVLSSMK